MLPGQKAAILLEIKETTALAEKKWLLAQLEGLPG
jgi:hypothetical protein